jgi:hypothetical protein
VGIFFIVVKHAAIQNTPIRVRAVIDALALHVRIIYILFVEPGHGHRTVNLFSKEKNCHEDKPGCDEGYFSEHCFLFI